MTLENRIRQCVVNHLKELLRVDENSVHILTQYDVAGGECLANNLEKLTATLRDVFDEIGRQTFRANEAPLEPINFFKAIIGGSRADQDRAFQALRAPLRGPSDT